MRVPILCLLSLCLALGCTKSPANDGKSSPVDDGTKKTPASGRSAKDENAPLPALVEAGDYALPRKLFEAGWIRLFDRRTLFGWTANSNANWSVKDGILTAGRGDEGLLVTDVPFADYELVVDFRLQKGGNSGIFLRTAFKPTSPAKDCYELNLCDTHKTFPTGSLVARKVADVKTSGEGQWQRYHVVVRGRKFAVTLQGKKVLDFEDTSANFLPSGFIGLQFRDGKVEFRNVLLKPLGGRPLINGKDLSGWKPVPGSKAKFSVDEGAIRVKGGPGNLGSDAAFGDFLLQVDVWTGAKNVNSGIFFRSMKDVPKQSPGGYELQVHNGFADGDRTKPNDYGTGFGSGAIFRRQKARRVIPDDNEWFTMTLVAAGDRFASWVNGYQVTDWRDDRKPNENPRRGKRLKAGPFFLQGHDPTSDARFRSFRVIALPAAK